MGLYKTRDEILEATSSFQKELIHHWEQQGIDTISHGLKDLEAETERATFWDNPERARKISQKKAAQEKLLLPWKKLKDDLNEFPDLIEIVFEEQNIKKEAIHHLEEELSKLREQYEKLLMTRALMGQDDGEDAILTLTSGAGGTESQDWAEMIFRMYLRWCGQRGFSTDILDLHPGEEAGIKNVSIMVKGESAYGYLKSENGIHRLVRLSPFDSNKKRHTSFCAVHVMPQVNDSIEVEIEEKDLRIDTYRASGAGGQHVNKTDSAIRITHIPSKVVVQCQNERSQHKNKATAMKMLKSKLWDIEKQQKSEDIESRSGEKRDVAWGNQIRSYIMHPYKMVKDLRTGMETSNVEEVMNGGIDPFIEAYLKKYVK